MDRITPEVINHIANVSRLDSYSGEFKELGGGELNDTFVLACDDEKLILRISKHAGTATLRKEADALRLLNIERVPKLIFFDEAQTIEGRPWIIESFLEGQTVDRLNTGQYSSLGELLAHVHAVIRPELVEIDFWGDLLKDCSQFGDEASLLNHPDLTLRKLMHTARPYFQNQNGRIHLSLIHGDATPSNVRITGNEVLLIDWELSRFKDPMADFSTIYYPDMEYNKGKWRVHITEDERDALFAGYRIGGGAINEDRLNIWMNLDKLGAATYLHWKIHNSKHDLTQDQLAQYNLDYANLIKSLQNNLP